MKEKKTLVIGASENPDRYSYLAINRLRANQHPVVAIGNHNGTVAGVSFTKDKQDFEGIDTVTLYINPKRQPEYYNYIIGLKPKRIIFNPGTENPELEKLAAENGIEPVEACTLVLLSTGQF
jgi:predicted CoA-binding protein